MTNGQKAREISAQYEPIGVAEDAALEMAEWKDQQFKEYLEKVRQDYAHELCVNRDWKQGAMEARIKHEVIVKIINELFGEE